MNSLELPTLISKEKIDNRKQTWKIRVKENNKNSSLIEIETGPEGGDCFIYEEELNISKKKDTNDDLFQLGIKRARELYDEQIKDGFVVLDEEEKILKK